MPSCSSRKTANRSCSKMTNFPQDRQGRPEQARLWTKNFVVLSTVNFFVTLIFFLLNATIALYAMREFQASSGQTGLIAGIFIIGSLTGRLWVGRLAPSKTKLLVALLLFALTTLLYFVQLGIGFLVLSRFLNGVTLGVISTVVSTIVVLSLPASRKGEGISYFAVSTALATGLGPFIGLYMIQHTSFGAIFVFCLALGLVNLLIAVPLAVSAFPSTTPRPGPGFKISDFIEPRALPISIHIFVMTFCFSAIVSYLNLYAIELDLVDTAGFFFMVYTVFVLVSRPFTGKLIDKKGANLIMYPAFVLFGAGMMLLGSAWESVGLLVAAALIALGFGNLSSVSQTAAVQSVEPGRVGLATATFFLFFDLGNGFGPALIGLLIPLTGYRGLYVLLGGIIWASILLYYFLYGKKESRVRKFEAATRKNG